MKAEKDGYYIPVLSFFLPLVYSCVGNVELDKHRSDTLQEKLSLAARFGVQIYYGAPDKKEFENIVKVLAEKYGIKVNEKDLYLEANKWEISHGGLSGRTATQFINYMLGKES